MGVEIGDLLEWFAAAVYLLIALVAVRRVGNVPLARPLAFFALGIVAYVIVSLSTPGEEVRGLENGVENAIASLIFIPAVQLLLGFAGRRRELRRYCIGAYVYFIALALYCVTPWYDKAHWEPFMFGGIVFFFGHAGWVLVVHYRRSGSVERVRTMLLFGALLLGGIGAASTLLHDHYQTPELLEVGMASTGVLLAALFFRTKLLRGTTALSIVTAAVFASVLVIGEVVLYTMQAQTPALFIAGSIVSVLLAFVALRPVFGAISEERARAERLSALGLLTSEMAHNLKNPLAAIVFAAEYLEEEKRQGRSLDDSAEHLDRILEQSKRLEKIVNEYQRLSRVEPALATVALAGVLEGVVEAQKLVAPAGVELKLVVSEDLGATRGDVDLLTIAVENLVRNAFEAVPQGGEGGRATVVTVSGSRKDGRIIFTVEDDGPGMDARTRDQALGGFFTTKAHGSGLGLTYASRVAEAHGGQLELESAVDEGTTVTLALPA